VEEIDAALAVAKAAWGVVVTVFAWLAARQIKRIDRLEARSATREELNQRFAQLEKSLEDVKAESVRTREELRQDMREHREESRETLGRIFQRLDALSDRARG